MALVGIDIGTQSLKVVVCSDELSVLGSASLAYAVDYPRPGWAEQEPDLWLRAVGAAIPQALDRAGVVAGEIAAVGVAGQLDGCLAVDASGMALTPCLIWMDRRADDHLPGVDAARLRSITGLVLDGGHMAAKIAWMNAELDLPADARFHQPVSYLVERLCGAYVFDRGLASTTMLYSVADADWDRGLLSEFGVASDRLPAIRCASDVAGPLSEAGARLTGLRAGIPVAVGTGDDFATPLGAGLSEPGAAICVLGTAEVVGALSSRVVIDDSGLVETHAYVNDAFFVENPGWLSGGAVAWARGLLGFDDDRDLDRAAASAPPGCHGLTFFPALTGAMAPTWNARARGCFYGLTPAHGQPDLARAVLEGCAFAMRDVLTRLEHLGVGVDPVVLVGGGANSTLWAQMRADIAGRPVEVAEVVDACPLGAAALASVAAGRLANVNLAAQKVCGTRQVYRPQSGVEYDLPYRRYRELCAALRPLFDDDDSSVR